MRRREFLKSTACAALVIPFTGVSIGTSTAANVPWVEPHDAEDEFGHRIFQDVEGTIPATKTGDPVMLIKSKYGVPPLIAPNEAQCPTLVRDGDGEIRAVFNGESHVVLRYERTS